jgi:hypothetical protein
MICSLLKYLKYLKCYNNVVNKKKLPELDVGGAVNVSVIGVHCIMNDFFSGFRILIRQK